MNHRLVAYLCGVVLMAVLVPAGAQDISAPSPSTVMAESSQPTTANGVPEVKWETEMHGRELAGTSWRLVKIMSMDGSVYEPDDTSKYNLDFRADGTAEILADCNRGTGTWTSTSAGQLQFGPIAATKALCSLDSL